MGFEHLQVTDTSFACQVWCFLQMGALCRKPLLPSFSPPFPFLSSFLFFLFFSFCFVISSSIIRTLTTNSFQPRWLLVLPSCSSVKEGETLQTTEISFQSVHCHFDANAVFLKNSPNCKLLRSCILLIFPFNSKGVLNLEVHKSASLQ